MGFVTEWILAINRAVWFPALWLLGLEARPVEAVNFDDLRKPEVPCTHGCSGRRTSATAARTNGKRPVPLLQARPSTAIRSAATSARHARGVSSVSRRRGMARQSP